MNEKLDQILSKLDKMEAETSKRFDQNEIMISSLIKMVGAISADLKDTKADLAELRTEVKSNHIHTTHQLTDLNTSVEFIYDKTNRNEMDLYKLKKNSI